jgi:hypothetical protein
MFWIALSALATIFSIIFAHRVDSGETLGARQALYLAAFCFVLFGGYNYYQWEAARTAPDEISVYLPLYPDAEIKTRIPVEHFSMLERFLPSDSRRGSVRGEWTFESPSSANDVGRFYQDWARRTGTRARIQMRTESAVVVVNTPHASMNVTARNHLGRTRITYTLTDPLT